MRRWRTFRQWLAILMVGSTLTIGALALIRAVKTVGDPFAGFFVGPNLLVAISQRASWPGIQAGLHSLDRIVAVEGQAIHSVDELIDHVSKHLPGTPLVYDVVRGDQQLQITIPVDTYGITDFVIVFLAPFLMGLLFISFGTILYFAQPDIPGSFPYLTFCCVVGLFCMVIYEAYTTFAFFRLTLIYPLIGALATHLFSTFHRGRNRERVTLLVASLYAFAIALVIWRQISLASASDSVWLSKFSSLFIVLVIGADLLLLVRAYQRAPHQEARDRVKIILVGLFLASAAFLAWSLNFLLQTRSFYLDEQILLSAAFPLFMGYAILRRNIFNLDRVIRLSLSYGVAAAIVLILYLAAVGGVRNVLPASTQARFGPWLFVVLAGVGAFVFNLLRRRVNQLVRRMLFRSQHDLHEALATLDRSLGTGLSSVELAERVGRGLTELLGVKRAAVLLLPSHPRDEPTIRPFRWTETPPQDRWLTLFETEGLLEDLRKKASPRDVTELESERPGAYVQSVAILRAHNVELLLPFVSTGKLYGFLLLGEKMSGDRFDSFDLRAMHPLVVRIGLALENAHLAAEAVRQTRLAALGAVASVMVHDIKNPLGTIKIAAGSIKRRFREGDHSYELAQIIEEEIERMNGTVQDILHYSKPSDLSLQEISLNRLIDNVAERLRPFFAASGVSLIVETASDEIPIQADESRMRRVLENLLANAKDATPSGGTVRLRSELRGQGNGHAHMLLTVEDTGPGVEPEVREKIFQPFFTTKANGTGLGLAIVQQIVREHGGDIELESFPGKGSRFLLQLPVRSKV